MIETERLVLRPWREADKAPFAALNADPEVRRYFPSVLTRAESDASAEWIMGHFERHGFGFWAVERKTDGAFLGFNGLGHLRDDDVLFPAVEIGWRFAREAWGHGYATEGARAALAYGFETLGLDEVIAYTARGNARSEAVMRRIGMTRDPGRDFDHPRVADGSPLKPHIVYAARR